MVTVPEELTTPRGAALRGRRGSRARLAAWGEDVVAAHLESCGWVILARNWACDAGEIDLIAQDGSTVVFVEVKTRSGTGYGDPLEAVTPTKVRRLHEVALRWLAEHAVSGSVRIDAVGVLARPGERPRLTHVRGVR